MNTAANSSITPASPAVETSAYDQLLGQQIRSDDNFARHRAAWDRVAKALARALEQYLGSPAGAVEITLDSPSESDLSRGRSCKVTLKLADGFQPYVSAELCLDTRRPYGRSGETRGDSYSYDRKAPRGVEETYLAFPAGEVTEPQGYDDERALPAARVLSLKVETWGDSSIDIPLVYLPSGPEDGPEPTWFSMAMQGISAEGEFNPRGHAPGAIARLADILIKRFKRQIEETVHLRAKRREEPPPEPSWR